MKIFLVLLFIAHSVQAATLLIDSPNGMTKFSTSELLKKAEPNFFLVSGSDPAYLQSGNPVKYRVVPFSVLIEKLKIKPDAVVKFKCADGFSANLPTDALLSTDPKKARAFIAVEDPKKPWPVLNKKSQATPGPFYLVWKNPEFSGISREDWPYQIVEFQIAPPVAEQFPAIMPDPKLHEGRVEKGFQVFLKNCFTCHTMNGQGDSQMGPDLNLPFNPTEYFAEGYLAKWIRNPQSLHRWPQSKMPPFDQKVISDEDLQNLMAYLKQMAPRKIK